MRGGAEACGFARARRSSRGLPPCAWRRTSTGRACTGRLRSPSPRRAGPDARRSRPPRALDPNQPTRRRGVVRALQDAGATELSPSLHGSTEAIHDGLTRSTGSFRQSVLGIRNVARAGAPLITNSVITRDNAHDLPELVALLGSLGVQHAQLAFVHPVGTAMERFDSVVPRLSEVVQPVARAREVALRLGMRLVTEGIPYCFLRGMEELAVEASIPHTTVFDLDGAPADYSSWRVVEGKAHGPPCGSCARRPRCEGPWREVPAAFGWDDFVPFEE